MNQTIISAEPDATNGPVRVWADGTQATAKDLLEVRAGLDEVDAKLVQLLLERLPFVMDATLFKQTAGEVLAPKRQAAVIQKAVDEAKRLAPNNTDFHQLVANVYAVLVPEFVNMQAKVFDDTKLM